MERRGSRLNRREFVVGAGIAGLGLVAGCGLPFSAPPAAPVHQIGYLTANPPSAADDVRIAAFLQGMRDLAYVDGQNLVLERRHAGGFDRLADPAADLVRLQPAVILVPGAPTARAVLAATSTIPIVSTSVGTTDLVANGLAASHARPGGTVTGLSMPSLSLIGKQLQLLQDAVPSLARVAVLFYAANPVLPRAAIEAAASSLGLQLLFVGAGGPEELERGVDTATREHADGLFLISVGWESGAQTRIADLAIQSGLPSMWVQTDAVGRGGLMAYAPNPADMYRRAAYYVDRILKGTKPGDLPVEEPMTFEFVVNLRTAQALGITFPNEIMLQVTEVVQ